MKGLTAVMGFVKIVRTVRSLTESRCQATCRCAAEPCLFEKPRRSPGLAPRRGILSPSS